MAENTQKNTKSLSGKQLQAISLFMAGLQQKEVSERLGVNEFTLRRWREQPEFQEEWQKQKRGLLDKALAYFLQNIEEVARKMMALTDAENENVRLRACQAVLDNVKEGIELSELKERLEALEKAISREKPGLRRVA